MSKVVMFLADGLEECEALITVDILRRGGVEVVTASIKDEVTIHSSHGITFEADSLAKYLSYVDFDMVILPGGHQGTMNLKASPLVEKVLIDYAADETKKVAAICAAPSILGDLHLLEGQRATCFPGLEQHLLGAEYTGAPVNVEGRFITGKGMGCTIPFALTLLAQLEGAEKAEDIRQRIQYPYPVKF